VDGGNWKFVFMDWGHWELVDMDGSDGQVVTLGLESGIIGDPGQSEFLAFRGNPVGRSLVGVSVDFLFGFFAVIIDGGDGEFLLGLGFGTGGVVGLGVAVTYSKMHGFRTECCKFVKMILIRCLKTIEELMREI
jgi:hypothetical protein